MLRFQIYRRRHLRTLRSLRRVLRPERLLRDTSDISILIPRWHNPSHPRPPPLKRALPIGAICVLVGMRPVMKEIWHRQWLERIPEKMRKRMEKIESQEEEQ